MSNTNGFIENVSQNINNYANKLFSPSNNKSFNSQDFLNSNTLIAKSAFVLLVIIIFVILFLIISKIIMILMMPSDSPYIFEGMKDATKPLTIPQSIANKSAIPILRSKDEYEGIEFTYSYWMYVEDLNINNLSPSNNTTVYSHVFHKGSSMASATDSGIFEPNNCPGVYLYTGKRNISDQLSSKYPLLGLLIRMNVFYDKANTINPYQYYDDIYVDGIPIKKWVNIIIRVTSQNIVDVYVNGTLTKRHNLSNIVKQNYENIYINMNGGFPGNLSNLKYYNYAIGIFEIDKIYNLGPNLNILNNSGLTNKNANYLAERWYFNETNI